MEELDTISSNKRPGMWAAGCWVAVGAIFACGTQTTYPNVIEMLIGWCDMWHNVMTTPVLHDHGITYHYYSTLVTKIITYFVSTK